MGRSCRGGSGVDVGRGRLVLCVALVPVLCPLFPRLGRRKRPLPAQPFPRPYGYEAASEATS